VRIDAAQLGEYLGTPMFPEETAKRALVPGTAIGLAWTAFGGETLLIEAVSNPGKEGFKLTGQLGEVMQESAGIAGTWVRHVAARFKVPLEFFEKNQIHVHIPAGATPKDGPSAGITMASALLSLARGKRLRRGLAMTGELSLTGHVLPIGGLKEKVIAARRDGVKHIIIPKLNEKDLDEIPAHVKNGIVFHPVETMDEVTALIF
jgi:ATP-dependent Lon protease